MGRPSHSTYFVASIDQRNWKPSEQSPLLGTKRITFYFLELNGNDGFTVAEDGTRPGHKGLWVCGDMYLIADINSSFGPFRMPTRATVKDICLETDKGWDLRLKFFADGYIKFKVSRGMLSRASRAIPPKFQEMLEFSGILRDMEKEM